MVISKKSTWSSKLLTLLFVLFVCWQVYLILSIPPQIDNSPLNEAAENLLLNGYSWNPDITDKFWTFREWTIKNGLPSDLYLLDRLGIFIFKSADILRYEPEKAGTLPSLFVSLHFFILKFGFLLIATWKFILLAALLAFLYAKQALRIYSGQDLLGQSGDNLIFDSDIHLKNGVGQRVLPDGQFSGLHYPPVLPFEQLKGLNLYSSLLATKCTNDTNCDLVGLIFAQIQGLSKVALETEDKKLSYLFETELPQFPLEVVIKYGNSALACLILSEMAAAKASSEDGFIEVTGRALLFSLPAFVYDYSVTQRDFISAVYSCLPFVADFPEVLGRDKQIALVALRLRSLRDLLLHNQLEENNKIGKLLEFGLRFKEEVASFLVENKNGLKLVALADMLTAAQRIAGLSKINLTELLISPTNPKRQLLALEIAGKAGLEISQANDWLVLLEVLEQLKLVSPSRFGSSRLLVGEALVPFEEPFEKPFQKMAQGDSKIFVELRRI